MKCVQTVIVRFLSVLVIVLVLLSVFAPLKDVMAQCGHCSSWCLDWDCIQTDSYTWRSVYCVYRWCELDGDCIVLCADTFKPYSSSRIAVLKYYLVEPFKTYHTPVNQGQVQGKRIFRYYSEIWGCRQSGSSDDAYWNTCSQLNSLTC